MVKVCSRVRKCKKGERKAQYSVYQKWGGLMMSVCRRYVKSTEDAEEILSNGFVKVFKNIKVTRGRDPLKDGSERSWLTKL